MVWNQYLYLVPSVSALSLWKAQKILAVDFSSELLDCFLDPSVLHEPVIYASRDPRQGLSSIGLAEPRDFREDRQEVHARRRVGPI